MRVRQVLIAKWENDVEWAGVEIAQIHRGRTPINGMLGISAFVEGVGLPRSRQCDSDGVRADRSLPALPEFDQAGFNDVLNNPSEMESLVLFHLVTNEYTVEELSLLESITSDEGTDHVLSVGLNGIFTIGGHPLVEADRNAYNGIIHTIDAVLRPPAEPDACEDPVEIEAFGVFEGTTADGGSRYGSTCGALAESPEKVFSFTPDRDSRVCISTEGSDFDTVLHVREEVCEQLDAQANCPDEADMTRCNDDSGENGERTSALTLNTIAGQEYFIFIDGFGADASGNFRLEINEGACGEQPPAGNIRASA